MGSLDSKAGLGAVFVVTIEARRQFGLKIIGEVENPGLFGVKIGSFGGIFA